MPLNYCDSEKGNVIKMWSQGEIKIVSNDANLPKESSGFHKKGDFLDHRLLVSPLWLKYYCDYAISKKFIVVELT